MAFQNQTINPVTNQAPEAQGAGTSPASATATPRQEAVQPHRPVLKTWQAGESDKAKTGATDMTHSLPRKMIITVITVVLVAGAASGLGLAYFMPSSGGVAVVAPEDQQEVTDASIKNGAVFGVPDEKTFSDDTQGVLIKGGLEGEGSHTLLRPGGESQNVYMTSSVVDLDQFNNMEITVWGETFKGQKAGWLMDVGRVEVLNTKGEKPEWYEATQ